MICDTRPVTHRQISLTLLMQPLILHLITFTVCTYLGVLFFYRYAVHVLCATVWSLSPCGVVPLKRCGSDCKQSVRSRCKLLRNKCKHGVRAKLWFASIKKSTICQHYALTRSNKVYGHQAFHTNIQTACNTLLSTSAVKTTSLNLR
jgi:hypothetical protein